MLIGELSRASGRSVHALRWYERQGLIPHVGRDRGGRRIYSNGHVNWLRFLERLRLSGMSVKEMRVYAELATAGRNTLKERQNLLRAHRDKVTEHITNLTAALDLIDQKVDFYEQWQATGKRPDWEPQWEPTGDAS
jgi:DNA-binding transcriptional MerR regulator